MATKMEKFTVMISEGKPSYICTVCGRRLSSKQRVLLHLHQIHKMCEYKKKHYCVTIALQSVGMILCHMVRKKLSDSIHIFLP